MTEKGIHYTSHLKLRMGLRAIPDDLPKKIYQTAKERYFDNKTNKKVAVKSIKYKNKTREMCLIYEENAREITIITIHPLKSYQKLSRITSGRWVKL